MMQDLYWECKMCEACGVCNRTETQCDTYHEYYRMGGTPVIKNSDDTAAIVVSESSVPTEVENRGLMNWLSGQIVKVVRGDVVAQITIKIGDNYVGSIIPISDFEATGKNVGDTVTAVFKAANVKIMF